jgi:2-dehydropantoate 2-reductase
MSPVIAVVGAGAVGGYYGARLAQHGNSVHFLMRSGLEEARARGFVVQSPDGDFRIPPQELHIYSDPTRMPKADLVLVTLKATANDLYEPLIRPLVSETTQILTLQNGLGNEDQLAKLFGGGRILGGLAFVCINRLEDGTIRHLDHGHIKIGEFSGPPTGQTHRIARMFCDSQIRCEVLDDLRFGRWEKLVWNIPFNCLGALLNKTTDKLIGSENGIALLRRLMAEVIAAAAAQGIILPPDLPDRKILETQSMGAYRTSMQIDKQLGRPLEIEAILGRPLAAARNSGIATPYLEMLYALSTLPG